MGTPQMCVLTMRLPCAEWRSLLLILLPVSHAGQTKNKLQGASASTTHCCAMARIETNLADGVHARQGRRCQVPRLQAHGFDQACMVLLGIEP